MSTTSQDAIIALFSAFVQHRKTGDDRDTAWRQIEPQVRGLAARDSERLIALLRHWEATDGLHYKQVRRTAADPTAARAQDAPTQPAPPPQVIRPIQPASQSETAESVQAESRLKRLIRPLAQKTGLLSKPKAECPTCGQHNQNGEVVCGHCGQVLVGSHQARKASGTRPMETPPPSTAYFGADSLLVLRLPGHDKPISVSVSDQEMIIGRGAQESAMIPEVDLAPYQAEQYGISRLHASLRRHGDTLVITDLDSMNYTHVNGQRLHSHEVRVLNDGDEVRLGWMPVRVYFQHPT